MGVSPGVARAVARPDLVVSKGSVAVAASGKVTGRFVVSNTGTARAARSSAALTVRAAGRWRLVQRFGLPALRRSTAKAIMIAVSLPPHLPAGALRLRVCADSGGGVRERSESNNCRSVGTTAPSSHAPAKIPANTSPFRDTGSSQAASLAAAAWKFHVVHLAHTEDDTYNIIGVRRETDAMATAGFPITRIERPGRHFDADTATTGTDHDLVTLLLPHIDDGWEAP